MARYAEPMARLIEELKKLPGVGTKSAQRFAFHILRSSDDDAAACRSRARPQGQPASLLHLQQHHRRRSLRLLRQPHPQSAPRLRGGGAHQHRRRRARRYSGVYHVLHGTLSPLHGVGPDQLRGAALMQRVERGEVDEVILATSPTLEGEATASWLAGALRDFKVRITRIATGVPAGSDIEYADEVTMARAIEGRHEMKP